MGQISKIIDAIFSPALDLLYPPVCLACEKNEADGPAQVCQICWDKLNALANAQFASEDATGSSTGSARRVISLASYDSPLETLIKRFKYDGFTALGASLTNLLLERRKAALSTLVAQGADYLLPTPLYIVNYKTRGFNQAEIISDILSEGLGLPVAQDALAKVVKTKNQSLLSHEERVENLIGAFAGNPDRLEGKRVILVDDVITTGATIHEVGETAEGVGATVIGAVSLASALSWFPDEIIIEAKQNGSAA
jgi:ComF family protein